jgi:hypothetical protein
MTQDAALADEDRAETVGRRHAQDHWNGLSVAEAPIAAEHQHTALCGCDGVENRLDEVLQIARLKELRDLLTQAGCPGALALER